MSAQADLERQVAGRAGERCEYCRMHQSLQGASFHVEHILPLVRGGTTDLVNLAWACPGCNLRKSDRTECVDPETGRLAALFHPRQHTWSEHSRWDDYELIGETASGRATVAALELNHSRRIRIRQAEQIFCAVSATLNHHHAQHDRNQRRGD